MVTNGSTKNVVPELRILFYVGVLLNMLKLIGTLHARVDTLLEIR